MKFYRDKNNLYNYLYEIIDNNLSAIRQDKYRVIYFFKNGKIHNTKNAAYIEINGYKQFFINDHCYGYNDFTKKSWRRFVKLKAFL
jgi:hypothetical protein